MASRCILCGMLVEHGLSIQGHTLCFSCEQCLVLGEAFPVQQLLRLYRPTKKGENASDCGSVSPLSQFIGSSSPSGTLLGIDWNSSTGVGVESTSDSQLSS